MNATLKEILKAIRCFLCRHVWDVVDEREYFKSETAIYMKVKRTCSKCHKEEPSHRWVNKATH